jgi:hypothetical protein
MNCEKYMERVIEILDNGQDLSDYSDIAEHINNCPRCKKEYLELKQFFTVISDDENIDFSILNNLVVDINRKIDTERKVFRFNPKFAFSLLTAAAAVLIILFGGMNTQNMNSTDLIYATMDQLSINDMLEFNDSNDDLTGIIYTQYNTSITDFEDYYLENADYRGLLSDMEDTELENFDKLLREEYHDVS